MNMKLVLASVATVVALTGCASTQVNYGDAQSVETLNKDFGSTDLQMIADKMVTDMLSFPVVVQLTQNRRPVMFVDKIRNKLKSISILNQSLTRFKTN